VAVTVTPVAAPVTNPAINTYAGTVTATADGDTTASITHNLALTAAQITYAKVSITQIQALGGAAAPGWALTAIGANTATLSKSTATGSGAAGAQVAFKIERPYQQTL
jgi:hypothetical protein